jgi:hypothetical protein
MPTVPEPSPTPEALRAEYDVLARRLAVRGSVDVARRGLYQVFFGLLAAGLSVKLGWDRFGVLSAGVVRKTHPGPPLFLWIATIVTVVLLLLAIHSLVRSRRLARKEDALFLRYRALRATLGLDA